MNLHGVMRALRTRQIGWLSFLVIAAQGNCAHAANLCAATAQELRDDLLAASDGGVYAGQDVQITLAKGTFKTGSVTGNGPFAYHSTAATGNLYITGGYSADCSAYTADASLSVLDGNNSTQVLNIQNVHNQTFVEFVTIQNGQSLTAGGGLAINTTVSGGAVFVYDNMIKNNHTAGIGGGFAIDAAGSQIAAVGNVIVGNSADANWGAGFEYSRNGNQAFFDNNTVYGNTTTASGGTGGLYCCGTPSSPPELTANIFWQNTNYGVDLEGTLPRFLYNDYGTVTGTTTPDATNVSIAPKFIDAASGDYHLDGSSPLLGNCPADSCAVLATDLEGNEYAYPFHGYFDFGAYEDTIFTDHGFEAP